MLADATAITAAADQNQNPALDLIRRFEARPITEWSFDGIRETVAEFSAFPLDQKRAALAHLWTHLFPHRLNAKLLDELLRNRWCARLGSYQRVAPLLEAAKAR